MQSCKLYHFLEYDDNFKFKLLEENPKTITKITQALL